MDTKTYLGRLAGLIDLHLWILLAALSVTVLLSLAIPIDGFDYKIWGDREISRSAALANHFMVSGAELNGREGTRVPGGAFHYISHPLLLLNPSPKFVQWVIASSLILSGFYLGFVAYRLAGKLAASATILVFLTSTTTQSSLGLLWNPTFGVPFAVFGFALFVHFLLSGKNWYFVAALSCFAVSAQMQMAVIFSALLILLYLVLFRVPVSPKIILCASISILFLYSPWLLNRAFGLFPESDLLPALDPVLIVGDISVLTGRFDLVQFIKNVIIGMSNNVLVGEPNLIQTAVPSVALIMGVWVLLGDGAANKTSKNLGPIVRDVIIFIVFYLVTTALFFDPVRVALGGIGFAKQRYFVFLLPAAALLTGVSLALLAKVSLTRHGVAVTRLLVFFVLFAMAARAATTINANLKHSQLPIGEAPDYNDLVKIAKTVNQSAGFGSDKIKLRTSYWVSKNGRVEAVITPAVYVLDYLNLPDLKPTFSGCVFVVDRKDMLNSRHVDRRWAMDEIRQKIITENWLGLVDAERFPKLELLAERQKFYLFGLPLKNVGCPKSYLNPYLPGKQEKAAEKALVGQTESVFSGTGQPKFFVKHDSSGNNFPLFLSIDISFDDDETMTTVLHSNQLRMSAALLNGYFAERAISRPRLLFKDVSSSEEVSIVLYDGNLGKGTRSTPWSKTVTKPEPGVYKLLLLFQEDVAYSYSLTDRFVVQ